MPPRKEYVLWHKLQVTLEEDGTFLKNFQTSDLLFAALFSPTSEETSSVLWLSSDELTEITEQLCNEDLAEDAILVQLLKPLINLIMFNVIIIIHE